MRDVRSMRRKKWLFGRFFVVQCIEVVDYQGRQESGGGGGGGSGKGGGVPQNEKRCENKIVVCGR